MLSPATRAAASRSCCVTQALEGERVIDVNDSPRAEFDQGDDKARSEEHVVRSVAGATETPCGVK
ncbi:MAG: hypothetical protein P8R42_27625 [Candidatus Binatia bacterium]|nr:hypothetical protein [Candidatus Binatia bacterium]